MEDLRKGMEMWRGTACCRRKAKSCDDLVEYMHRRIKKYLYVYLGKTNTCGLGIFAAKAFSDGESIIADEDGDYYSRILSYRELMEGSYELENTLQVGLDALATDRQP